jgi:hypothetical protein
MKISTFGAIVASTVVGLAGSVAFAQAAAMDAKACYRPHCGKSIKGHEGKCAGMKVEELSTQSMCESAGGAWATAAEAKTFEKKHDK